MGEKRSLAITQCRWHPNCPCFEAMIPRTMSEVWGTGLSVYELKRAQERGCEVWCTALDSFIPDLFTKLKTISKKLYSRILDRLVFHLS